MVVVVARRKGWLTDDEQRAWRGYRRMRALLDAQLARDLAADSGLSESDYDVLSTLTEVEGHSWRASDLADRLLWSSSRLAHHIGRMERRGLVRREECNADRRGAIIVLTQDGWRRIQSAAPDHVASVRRHFIDVLSPDQLRALDEIAAAVLHHLEPATER